MTRHYDVRPRNIARALTLSFCFLVSGLSAGMANAGPPVDVNECVSYDEREVDASTTRVELASDCSASLRCEVSWTVTCEAGATPRKESKAFTLAAGSSRGATVSTKYCGDKLWELSDLTWSCVQR